ncbi:MAG TPA: response regulator [Burkholderiales bacterium]|nr:response regulator [Burkholderiales bacterium]
MPNALKRILVVDDQPDAAASLAMLLSMHGHDAKAVEDSRQAMPVAKQFRPNVAVLDLRMPHIDGLKLARLFRADPDLQGVVLIALTADADPVMRQRTKECGFAVHLLKPASDSELQRIITTLS